jgi:hypothetical protein
VFHHQGAYTHRAKVALADFDKGSFAVALRLSAATNNGIHEKSPFVNVNTASSSPEQIRHEVFKGTYWAAVVVQPGATARFEEALNGSAQVYDSTNVHTYYLLDARYYNLYVSNILSPTTPPHQFFSAEFIAPVITRGEYASTIAACSALTGPARAIEMPTSSQLFANLEEQRYGT